MKNKVVVLALATLASAPALAAAAVHQACAWPPGPSVWAWIMQVFAG
jgi:hypothetical protein